MKKTFLDFSSGELGIGAEDLEASKRVGSQEAAEIFLRRCVEWGVSVEYVTVKRGREKRMLSIADKTVQVAMVFEREEGRLLAIVGEPADDRDDRSEDYYKRVGKRMFYIDVDFYIFVVVPEEWKGMDFQSRRKCDERFYVLSAGEVERDLGKGIVVDLKRYSPIRHSPLARRQLAERLGVSL